MEKLELGDLPLTPQPEDGVIYAAKIDKGETRIDFAKAAQDVHNHIRGLSPFPGAWFEVEIGGKPERIKVLGSELASGHGAAGDSADRRSGVACASGAVRLTKLQKAGGKPLRRNGFPARHARCAPARGLADAAFPHDHRI